MNTENEVENPSIESIINELLLYNFCSLSGIYWSDELKIQLQNTLSLSHQIDDLKVYRAVEASDFILCIKGYEPYPFQLERAYPQRSFGIKTAPLFLLVMVVFVFTALLARDLGAMLDAEFILALPFIMGALAQYIISVNNANNLRVSFGFQGVWFLVTLMFSAFILKEGIICMIMAFPLIVFCQMIGAYIMLAFLDYCWKPSPKVYALSALPLLVLLSDPFSATHHYGTTKNEIMIHAPVEHVFAAINNIQDIKQEELKASPVFWMGFPKPVSGMTVQEGEGLTRQIHWQRGIYFEETITHSEPPYLLAWQYKFTPQSFPKGSLDDHVEIGGQYFDLASTDYRLERISPTKTKLILSIDYRLSTEINWYSKLWADYVLNEFSDVVLHVYKTRLET